MTVRTYAQLQPVWDALSAVENLTGRLSDGVGTLAPDNYRDPVSVAVLEQDAATLLALAGDVVKAVAQLGATR